MLFWGYNLFYAVKLLFYLISCDALIVFWHYLATEYWIKQVYLNVQINIHLNSIMNMKKNTTYSSLEAWPQ